MKGRPDVQAVASVPGNLAKADLRPLSSGANQLLITPRLGWSLALPGRLVGRGFQGTSIWRRLKAGCAPQRRRRGLFVELPPSRDRKLRQERPIPKRSLLTELWNVGCVGYKDVTPTAFAGNLRYSGGSLAQCTTLGGWCLQPSLFREEVPWKRRPTGVTVLVHCSLISLRIWVCNLPPDCL